MSPKVDDSAPLSPPEDVLVLRIEPRIYCYCAYRNVTVAVWVGQATVPALHEVGAISREMVRRYPDGHSSIVYILDKIPAPSPEASAAVAHTFAARNGLACVSVILEGTGFFGSGMRSMLSNARRNAEAESTALLKLNTSVAEVLEWLPEEHLRRTGVQLDGRALADAMRWVREHGAQRASNATEAH
jgi:hypothetical protein